MTPEELIALTATGEPLTSGFVAHPLLALVPARGRDEVRRLARRIERFGQMEPVTVAATWFTAHDDRLLVLDGRARVLACEINGEAPWVAALETTDGEVTRWLLARHERRLSPETIREFSALIHEDRLQRAVDAHHQAVRGPAPPEGGVYFAQRGPNGPIKIGYSDDPARRLAEIRPLMPEPLTVLAVMRVERHVERLLHRNFASARIRGEWFKPSASILLLIDRLNGAIDMGGDGSQP